MPLARAWSVFGGCRSPQNRISSQSATRLPSRQECLRRDGSCTRSLVLAPRVTPLPSAAPTGRQTRLRFRGAPGSSQDRTTIAAPERRRENARLRSRSVRAHRPARRGLPSILARPVAASDRALCAHPLLDPPWSLLVKSLPALQIASATRGIKAAFANFLKARLAGAAGIFR